MADSKKRVAGTQLTRDDPDPDENEPEPKMGSFKKASEEIMATRRIVKVKRANQQTAPSSNPFSGICLVPPTAISTSQETENESKNESEEIEKVEGLNRAETNETLQNGEKENGKGKEIENENKIKDDSVTEAGEEGNKTEVENTAGTVTEEVKENDGSASKEDVGSKIESKKETGNENESKAGEEEKAPVQAGPLSSFGQLSSSQNAFKGLAGTGFSTSSFSFGSGSTDGSAPISAFSNTGGPVFGSKPDTSLKEVPVETGEEKEKAVFSADAALFEFLQGGWKERGKGEVKLNVPVSDEGKKPRLVMRTKGNYRLVLNASLYPDMALKDMDKKGVTFACLNSASEGEAGLGFSTFALKFRDGGVRDDFCGVVSVHKGENEREEAAAVLKTPENSPKESNE